MSLDHAALAHQLGDARRRGNRWRCRCPLCGEDNLELRITADGTFLLHCWSGCRQVAVVTELKRLGLWPGAPAPAAPANTGSGAPPAGTPTRYVLRTPDGRPVAVHVRLDTSSGKVLWWERPDGTRGLGGLRTTDLPLYGIDRLNGTGEVVVTEGEKAAAALQGVGISAVGTTTGASTIPGDDALLPLLGRTVFLWPDHDGPGRGHMARIGHRLIALGADPQQVRWVEWPQAPAGGDAADFVAAGHGAVDVRRLLAQARPWTAIAGEAVEAAADVAECSSRSSRIYLGRAGRAFSLAPLGALLAEPEEEAAWLVEGLLPAGGVSLLAAKPKTGKSVTARCLALAVARGEPFWGRATTQGPVVYLALEEKRAEVARHFRALGAGEQDPIFVHVGAAPEEALAALAEAIAEHRPVLVIVDTLLRLVRVRDANDYAEVTRALEPVLGLARQSGAHLLLVHHVGKADRVGGDAILGSTAVFAAVDTAIILRRHPDNTRTVESVQRYGDDLPESVVRLDEDTGLVTLAGTVAERRQAEAEAAVVAVLDACSEPAGLTEPEIRDAAELKGITVSQALRRLVEQGIVERTGAGRKGDPFRYRYRRRPPHPQPPHAPHSQNALPALPAYTWEEREEHFDPSGSGDNGDSDDDPDDLPF